MFLRQLGLTYQIYPGATHTRFSHSLGTLHRTEQILSSIEQQTSIDLEHRQIARLYALVHDVTHLPFGHTLEDELSYFARHDLNHSRLMRRVFDSDLGSVLRTSAPGREVLALLQPDASLAPPRYLAEIVNGTLGADVLDYLDRDSLFCGLDQRIDTAIFRSYVLTDTRLQRQAIASNLESTHGLRLDREFAIESLLLHRYSLYLKVYTHRAKCALSALLDHALDRAPPSLTEEALELLGDDALLDQLGRRSRSSEYITEIMTRQLPVLVAEKLLLADPTDANYHDKQRYTNAIDPRRRRSIEATIAEAVASKDVTKDDVLLYLPRRAPGYQKTLVPVSRLDTVEPLEAPMLVDIQRRHLALWKYQVFWRKTKYEGNDPVGVERALREVIPAVVSPLLDEDPALKLDLDKM